MWKCHERYLNYEVHSSGMVRDTIFGNTVEPRKNRTGYLTVYLPLAPLRYYKRNGEASYTHTLHVVVATVHLPPPQLGQTIVDHKDGTRVNCCVQNLRWLSPTANNYNRRDTRGYSTSKYKKGKLTKAPDGKVFPVIWVRDHLNKRSRVYGRPVDLGNALETSKLIRENLISLLIAQPFFTAADINSPLLV